jgi:hypothetical protein
MHKQFQKDLIKLRLKTAKQYVQMLSDGLAPMSYAQGSQIRLNAQVMTLFLMMVVRRYWSYIQDQT